MESRIDKIKQQLQSQGYKLLRSGKLQFVCYWRMKRII